MVDWLAGKRVRGTSSERPLPVTNTTYSFTGSDQTFNAVSGTTYTVKMWGAGGSTGSKSGGAGGYVQADLVFSSNATVKVVVGKGGAGIEASSGGSTYAGSGYNKGYNGTNNRGSGYTGIFYSSVSHANSILVAGGGGTGSSNTSGGAGGNGGGTTGDNCTSTSVSCGSATGGSGGSQSSGGAGKQAGSALQAGSAINDTNYSTSAGGSGYYGGGSGYGSNGICGGNGGGGGSSYVGGYSGVTVSNVTNSKSSYNVSATGQVNPPNTSDSDYNGTAGKSGSTYNDEGGAGYIVIQAPATINLQDGTIFEETDTNKAYIWSSSSQTWTQL